MGKFDHQPPIDHLTVLLLNIYQMKNLTFKLGAPALIVLGFCIVQSCAKKENVIPQNTVKINQQSLAVADTGSVSGLYKVSSFVYQKLDLYNAYRICRSEDSTFYVTDGNVNKLFKISPKGAVSVMTTFNPNSFPSGLKAGANGSVYVALAGENRIVKIDRNGVQKTVPVSLSLNSPIDLAIAPDSSLYIADFNNARVLKINRMGVTSVFAGKTGVRGRADGTGENARFVHPFGIRYATDGKIWLLDYDPKELFYGKTLRSISLGGMVSTFYTIKKIGNSTGIVDFAPSQKDKNFNPTKRDNFFLLYLNITSQSTFQYKVSHLSYTGVETTIVPYHDAGDTYGPATGSSLFYPNGLAVTFGGIYLAGAYAISKISRQ